MNHIVENPQRFVIRTFNPPNPELHHPELKLDMDTAEDFINLSLLDITPDITPENIVRLFA